MTKLIGYVGGREVKFDFSPPDLFIGEIPSNNSGIYVVELHAIDDAGNVTNYCDVKILINFDKMSIKVLEMEYDNLDDNHKKGFDVVDMKLEYDFIELPLEYIHKELMEYDNTEWRG